MHRILLLSVLVLVSVPAGAPAATGFRQLTVVHPVAVQRGTDRTVQIRCNFTLDESYAVFFDRPGITATFEETAPIEAPMNSRGDIGTPFRFHLTVPPDQPTGIYEMRVATRQAVSSITHILVTDYPVIEESQEANDQPGAGQAVSIPAAICGLCDRKEDVDCYRFTGRRGQRITAQVYAQRVTECIHIMLTVHPIYHMNSIVTLIGPSGQVVAENDNFYGGDSFLSCELPEDGEYVVQIRDVRYAGNLKFTYCLELSERPFLTAMFPLAVQEGTEVEARPVGYGFDEAAPVKLGAPTGEMTGWKPYRYSSALGPTNEVALLTSPHPQYAVAEGSNSVDSALPIELPCGISGRLAAPDSAQVFAFDAKAGQYYRFEIEAERHGLPLDGLLQIFDAAGAMLAEADDTPGSPQAWAWSAKDSVLRFHAPADGRYFVAVSDVNGRGGDQFVYYLRAEPDGPDFELFGEYYYAMLAPGTRMLWFARIKRLNGFDGPVTLGVEGLPPGVEMAPATIPAGMEHCALILSAAADAPINASLVRVYGTATVTWPGESARELTHYGRVTCELQEGGGSAQYRWPCKTQIVGVTKPLDLVRVEANPTEITLAPGGRAEIAVRITRADGNTDPVTLAMSHMYYNDSSGDQLPPGVKLSSDSRLQLTGTESEAKIILEAEANALTVQNLPIAVMARVFVTYNISTNYASTPISLTVQTNPQ